MSLAQLQPLAWCAAFWVALFLYTRRARSVQPLRFACALALGAVLAHLGWLLLQIPALWPALRTRPGLWLDPSIGYCVLFVPLGPVLLERSAAAFASLPVALAVARVGCLAAGCCHGTPTTAAWGVMGTHPTALYEIVGLFVLHGIVSRAGERYAAPLTLSGIGALRLLLDPLRAASPLGPPPIAPATLGFLWFAGGAIWALAEAGLVPSLRRPTHVAS